MSPLDVDLFSWFLIHLALALLVFCLIQKKFKKKLTIDSNVGCNTVVLVQSNLVGMTLVYMIPSILRHMFARPSFLVQNSFFYTTTIGNCLGTSLIIGNLMIIKVTVVEWTWLGLEWSPSYYGIDRLKLPVICTSKQP
jgi:hypothetical protein